MTNTNDEFLQRLVAVVEDLKESRKDDEAMMKLGSLAVALIDETKTGNWTAFKAALTADAYNELLGSFDKQGNKALEAGETKTAYAIQAAATSLVASRLADERIAGGNALLDVLIDETATRYRLATRTMN